MKVNVSIRKLKGKKQDIRAFKYFISELAKECHAIYEDEEILRPYNREIRHLGNQILFLPLEYLRDVETDLKVFRLSATIKIWVFDDAQMVVRGFSKKIK